MGERSKALLRSKRGALCGHLEPSQPITDLPLASNYHRNASPLRGRNQHHVRVEIEGMSYGGSFRAEVTCKFKPCSLRTQFEETATQMEFRDFVQPLEKRPGAF